MGAFYFPLGDAKILADSDRQEHAPRNFLPWPLRLLYPCPLGRAAFLLLQFRTEEKWKRGAMLLTEEQSGTLLFR